jgi:hypothetical protein
MFIRMIAILLNVVAPWRPDQKALFPAKPLVMHATKKFTIVSAIGFLSGSKFRSMSSNLSRCESDKPLITFAVATGVVELGRSSSRFRRSRSRSSSLKQRKQIRKAIVL